jgi:hypothetical protein
MRNKSTNIIGIDCATKDYKTGLALGFFNGGKLTIQEVAIGRIGCAHM